MLANHFLADMNRAEGTTKVFLQDATDRLLNYYWRGNVRELHNVVQRAYIMAEGDNIDSRDLPQDLGSEPQDNGP